MNRLRRLSIAAILSLATTALVGPPAVASNHTVDCTGGGSFTITLNVVENGGTCAGTATIPNGVTSIGDFAFSSANSLTSITIPNNVTSIGVAAFQFATSLTTVNFESGSNLLYILDSAFYANPSLTSITIPNKVITIGSANFYSTALTSLNIPQSVASIGDYTPAFSPIIEVNFEGNAPTTGPYSFFYIRTDAVANIGYAATGFGNGPWNGLTLQRSTGPALTPNLSTSTRTADGYTLQITNYDADYTWTGSVTAGSVTVNSTGEVTVSGVNAGEPSTLTITTTRQFYSGGSATDTSSALDAPASALEAPTQAPYTGPMPSNYSNSTPSIGEEVTITGRRLNLITSCTIDGIDAQISNQSADSITILIPAGLEPGVKDLVMTGPSGKLTALGAITIQQPKAEITNEALVSTKLNAGSFNGFVAVYAKGHKGKILSWKIGNKWFKTTITSDYQVFQRKILNVGRDMLVDIYVDSQPSMAKVVTSR